MKSRKLWALAALFLALGLRAPAQVAILRIQVTEGEGAVHAPGSRTVRPLTVEVTDETGRPVPGAAVSFHLPDDGPGGVFANGLRTQVLTTDGQGRAGVRGMVLNRNSGRFEIRIIASKEQARAGTVSFQYVAEPAGGAARPAGRGPGTHSRAKWIVIAVVAGGGAVAGILAAGRGSTPSQPSATGGAPTIGSPTITVGKP